MNYAGLVACKSKTSMPQFFKQAIRNTANNADKLLGAPTLAVSLEDKLGFTLKLIRGIERGLPNSVSSCLSRFPHLAEKISHPYDFERQLSLRLQPLRDFCLSSSHETMP